MRENENTKKGVEEKKKKKRTLTSRDENVNCGWAFLDLAVFFFFLWCCFERRRPGTCKLPAPDSAIHLNFALQKYTI